MDQTVSQNFLVIVDTSQESSKAFNAAMKMVHALNKLNGSDQDETIRSKCYLVHLENFKFSKLFKGNKDSVSDRRERCTKAVLSYFGKRANAFEVPYILLGVFCTSRGEYENKIASLVNNYEISTVFSGSKKLNLTNLRANIFYINRTMGYIQDKSYLKDRIHHEDSTNLKSFNDISNRTGYKIKLETDSIEYRFINPLVFKDQERNTIIREIIGNAYPHETPITSTFDDKRYDPGLRRDEEERIESYGERNELLAERRDENLPKGIHRDVERDRYLEHPERVGDVGVVETRERKISSPPQYGGQPSPRDYDSYRDYDKYRDFERFHPTERGAITTTTFTTGDQKIGKSEMEKPYDSSYARGYTREPSGIPERIDAQRDTRDRDLVGGQQFTRERRESGGIGDVKRFEQPAHMTGRDTRDREYYDEQRQHPAEFRREGQQALPAVGGTQRRDSSSTIPAWKDEPYLDQQHYYEHPYRDQSAVGTTQRRDSGAIARDTDRQPYSSAQAAQQYSQEAAVARDHEWQNKDRLQPYQDSNLVSGIHRDTNIHPRDLDWQNRDRGQQYRNLDSTRDTNMQQQPTGSTTRSPVQLAKQYFQDAGVMREPTKERGSQHIIDSGVSKDTTGSHPDRQTNDLSIARDNGWHTKDHGPQHFQDVGVAREPNWQDKIEHGSQYTHDAGVAKDSAWHNTGSHPGTHVDDSRHSSRFHMDNFPSAT